MFLRLCVESCLWRKFGEKCLCCFEDCVSIFVQSGVYNHAKYAAGEDFSDSDSQH